VEVVGADGRTLGRFEPAPQPDSLLTDEEIAEAIAEPDDGPWYTLDEIKAEWRRRQK
jgi:hypothetical protein